MQKRIILFMTLIIVITPLLAFAEFRAGFAEKDITPSVGMEMPGDYGKAHNDGAVHDSLKARAVVFDDGQNTVALIGIDAIAIPAHAVQDIRQRICKSAGIEPGAVMIGASHTHTGGPAEGVHPGQFDGASEFVQNLAYEYSIVENQDYIRQVSDAVVAAVVSAAKNRVPVRAAVGAGHEDKVAFNRRFFMKNGLTYTHPANFGTFGNSDIDRAAGPIDPQVGVLGVWDTAGAFMGCVVNYSNHCTNGMPGISADYVYYLEQTICGIMGDKAIVVFLNGACGDVTQVDNFSADDIEFGIRSARFIGTSIGAEALKVLTKAEPGVLTPVAAKSAIVHIPHRKPSAARVQQSIDIIKQGPEIAGQTAWTFAKEIILADALVSQEPAAEVELQAIQIGPAVFCANPAELFCQIGLDIKAKSTFPLTCIVELANGCIGYVPTVAAFDKTGGGYETRLTSYSNLVIDAATTIIDSSAGLINSLTPGMVPQPPQKAAFVAPWSYGDVAPEKE